MRSLSLIALVVICLPVFGGMGCERRVPSPVSPQVLQGDVPDRESWNTRFYVSEDGRPRVEIEAAYMAEYEREDSTYMLLRGLPDSGAARVTVRLFDERGEPSATLTAARVYYYDREQRFEAHGDVRVVTRTGRRLETEDLFWDERERIVRTPGFVRITTEKEQLQGYELEADEDLATYRLRRVTGRRTVEDA
ncbi:LPS export ABC transporter periplasmic protein LptC [Rhodocaloribacter litoris]|uniref:LPS export ABC transporter periplasmic protein LptC n=1 Tax=Rhodocaloribacter litoris TaxID=2558931 RepID=UPI0014201F92|nr:LPS export ABC transporter periplasmic protein LptC [Rhodocaloribacter litoris]QXD14473.1 LPS export ABC transporter periplasmic protein LptC [Rhodocaloribacter litoris]